VSEINPGQCQFIV